MLQIKNIKKAYTVGELTQHALNDVSVSFRDNEFVSILGPSGSGKTTLLNIIGGLDSYDSGDLIIEGISTKDYKDRDWDAYRNDAIGFVFQSYNLIPHQSVLGNVELALTIGGVSKAERRERAVDALTKVGLKDHIKKKPNQLSGGQMQRVAIARALVNNPAILLADEPTGALDTQTSVQIMELLKEVAKDRLVVMVTHNPELANEYSSRIVKLKDGVIESDSNPFTGNEEEKEPSLNIKKTKMSWLTSMSLSLKNLSTKKRRTLLTAFAGSIGIIGISLVLSLSTGVNQYIADLQNETMASYPLTISAESMNLPGSTMMGIASEEKETDRTAVYSDYRNLEISSSMSSENNLTKFKTYLDDPSSEINQYLYEDSIEYLYNINFSVYSYDSDENLVNTDSDPEELTNSNSAMSPMMGSNPLEMMYGGSGTTNASNFSQIRSDSDNIVSSVITDNYNLAHGKWPEEYNEVVLFLNEDNTLSIETLYQLGLVTDSEYVDISQDIEDDKEVEDIVLDYEEITSHSLYMITASERFEESYNGMYSYLSDEYYEDNEDDVKEATKLNIVGIAYLNTDDSEELVSTPIGYTSLLTDYVVKLSNESPVVKAQKDDPETNILIGRTFESTSDTPGMPNYEDNMAAFGQVNYNTPSTINIYTDSFEAKDGVSLAIENYNKGVEEEDQIIYTDYIEVLISSMTSMIDVISYVLIAFVSVSLIVSCIMIGIITHISVMERTKEIGVLRALGASKFNISQVFNAETIIIGFCSGLIGIIVTLIVNIPITAIIQNLLDGADVAVSLPLSNAVVLIILSVIITVIGGLIPAKAAAKKDPVIALRTE